MNRLYFAAALILISSTSFAQFMRAEGVFISKSIAIQVILLDEENGIAAVSAEVAQGTCGGRVSGVGKIKGKKLIFTPYVKIEGGELCAITVDFTKNWAHANITENSSCAPYHGAACGWEGQITIKKSVK